LYFCPQSSIKQIWELTKDLIVPHKPLEQRHQALLFYQKLIIGQYENLEMMRTHFFRVIEHHKVLEDQKDCLDLLKSLTANGKDIQYFEERIGKFMLGWFDQIVKAGQTVSFLEIVVNLIKYNATYMDKEIIVGFIFNCCYVSCSCEDNSTVLQCLAVLDAVICYALFPSETLVACVFALCRNVNREAYCQTSYKIMKNLLGTNLGHAAILIMCNILNEATYKEDAALLRGSVFHINIGLWGTSVGTENSMLKCSPSTVLLSFLNVSVSTGLFYDD
jgi:tuberous sclerosis 2